MLAGVVHRFSPGYYLSAMCVCGSTKGQHLGHDKTGCPVFVIFYLSSFSVNSKYTTVFLIGAVRNFGLLIVAQMVLRVIYFVFPACHASSYSTVQSLSTAV
jgi:hypothetical protein